MEILSPREPGHAGKLDARKWNGMNTENLGYILLFVSLSIYATCEWVGLKDNRFMIFWIHYFICVTYTIILISNGSYGIVKSWRKRNISKTAIAANLYLISAYALNRELQIFDNSVYWLCVYIILTSFNTLSFQYFDRLPSWIHNIQYTFLGAAIVLYLYLALYIGNTYIIGAIGIVAFGIGIHVLVPITLLALCLFLFKHNHTGRQSYYWLGAGIIFVVAVGVTFAIIWNSRISGIEKFNNQSVIHEKSDLPTWVSVAEHMENDWISHRILKSGLVYSTSNKHFGGLRFWPGSVSWDEIKTHDPLVFISSMIAQPTMSTEERVKVLKAISNGRHKAHERLWSGDNLTTSYIVSDIDIYPDLRLSYTEKYLTVTNNAEKGGWRGNSQEAIYTFYLPEGSVVTSLSLWIDGKEEKAILTSKQKATTAYKTIVGVEQRDPSVVHWQEGNTVSVRVFPCTTEEARRFKIGITSPLLYENGNSIYRNVRFEGPSAMEAEETMRIRIIGQQKDLLIPKAFKKDLKGNYLVERGYDPDFSLSFKAPPIAPNQFTFDGFTYSIKEFNPTFQILTFKKIYLDINESWTNNELSQLKDLLNQFQVYAWDEREFIQLTPENWNTITSAKKRKNFSLFPFYKIEDVASTLVVSKGKILSPHLSDLKESEFAERITQFFSSGRKINLFNLTGGSSTYINSLKEFRGLEFASGAPADLLKMLSDHTFPKAEESPEKIILHDGKITISKVKSDENPVMSNAPDHLARVFAYNDIMRKVGSHYLSDDFINEELVDEAATAYVVSPVSSLIVLETQNDYERFGIEDKENSLHNATKQSSGAVPEPHEWALIVLFGLFITYLKFRQP